MTRTGLVRSTRSVGLVGLLALAICGSALATGASIKLKGPSSNKLGAAFSYKITGFAPSAANTVAIFEEPGPSGAASGGFCASTFAHEQARSTAAVGTAFSLADRAVKPNKHFSFTMPFTARNAGTHYLCGYVINVVNGMGKKTFAHAAAHWTNHA